MTEINYGKLAGIVARGAEELRIALDPGVCAAFETYYAFLENRGHSVNLTAITGVDDVSRLHFLDSIALLKFARFDNARVIDIGSGAGFPGIPLKIAEPSIGLTLLDAAGKRVGFTAELCEALCLEAECVHSRAEDAARRPELRGKFDISVSRAVARLNVLCELCLPFVRTGGVFIAMKGVDSADELAGAQGAIEALGALAPECFDYMLPGTGITHRAVVIRKSSDTPDKFPRRFAKIQKAPL